MPEPIDAESMSEARDIAADLAEAPHPFEAAATREVSEADEVSRLASRLVHENPPGYDAASSSRPIWLVEHFAPGEEGRPVLAGWCWFATEGAAHASAATYEGATTVQQTPLPRSVRSGDVEAYLAAYYREGPTPIE